MKKLLLLLLCVPLMFSCGENNTEEESFKSKYTPCYCTETFTKYYEKSPENSSRTIKTVPGKYSGFAEHYGKKENKEERNLRLELWECMERYDSHYDYYIKCKK
ncbi:MAG: hypothetical protein HOM24_03600 [Flavobacteriales bacterium]|jgi:hypothetical protein|nr:hypothetical protein [Flavobacteriales bacterium]